MRVSSSNLHESNVSLLNQQHGKLFHTQQQLGSGRRMLTPSDDPFASARALEISQSDSANTQFATNRNAAKHSANMAETILDSVTSLLQDVRTAAVGDGNGILTRPDKLALAEELRERYEELVGLANSTDGVGNYLFSGYQGRTQPFVKGPHGIHYMGDDGQRIVQVAASRQLATSDSGADIFMRIRNGNGKFALTAAQFNVGSGVLSQGTVTNPAWLTGHDYKLQFEVKMVDGELQRFYDVIDMNTQQELSKGNRFVSGQSINFDGMQFDISGEPGDCDEFYVTPSENESLFKTMSDLIVALKTDNPKGGEVAAAQYSNSLNHALNNFDRSLQNISTIRTALGSRLREIDALHETGEDLNVQYKAKLSELQDVDFNKAVSDLNLQQASLVAAQKTYKQVSDLSLFNYL